MADDRPLVTIAGLGPGGEGQITGETLAVIDRFPDSASFVRTRRHPNAHHMARAASFDEVYDAGDSLDDVYRSIADRIVDAATAGGEALYTVPGSPLVLERAVRYLRTDDRVDVRLLPAISFLDTAWASLTIDPVEARVRMVDGHTFAGQAAGETGPLLVAHAHAPWVLSDIKLAIDAGPEMKAIVLQRLGTDEEQITEVAWPDLDRIVEPDHLTSLYLPEVTAPIAQELMRTVELMHRLRQECPWDQKQTHASLRKYLIEEAYEVVEAIDRVTAGDEDGYLDLEEELGDLWFQMLFHAELATEAGAFTLADVAQTVHDKLVGRHPHVFGDTSVTDAADVEKNWEAIKKTEKGRDSVMDGIPAALPALTFAEKVLKKAQRSGATAEADGVSQRLTSADLDAAALADAGEEQIGELLLAVVERARLADIDPEGALRSATARARDRFQAQESSGTPSRWIYG